MSHPKCFRNPRQLPRINSPGCIFWLLKWIFNLSMFNHPNARPQSQYQRRGKRNTILCIWQAWYDIKRGKERLQILHMFLATISCCFLFPTIALCMDKFLVLMLLNLYLKTAKDKTIPTMRGKKIVIVIETKDMTSNPVIITKSGAYYYIEDLMHKQPCLYFGG